MQKLTGAYNQTGFRACMAAALPNSDLRRLGRFRVMWVDWVMEALDTLVVEFFAPRMRILILTILSYAALC
ncbi:MAG: hypothetical protein AMXMBFR13_00800 [Phycisphaerae bacterium]